MSETFSFKQYNLPADKYPDQAFPKGHKLYLPVIEIKVRHGSKTTPSIWGWVDSGASYCLFDDNVARLLRIQVTSGKLKTGLVGVSGSSVNGYFFDVQVLIRSTTINCYAAFMNQSFPPGSPQSGLIGNFDFLSKLKATLDRPVGDIVLGWTLKMDELSIGLFLIFVATGMILALSRSAQGGRLLQAFITLALGGGGGWALCSTVTVQSSDLGRLLIAVASGTMIGVLLGLLIRILIQKLFPGGLQFAINVLSPPNLVQYEEKDKD
jgi:hypothetical protein